MPPHELPEFDEERLGELIALLPPAPVGWTWPRRSSPPPGSSSTRSSSEPARTRSSARRLVADLEDALASAGYEPRAALLAAVR